MLFVALIGCPHPRHVQQAGYDLEVVFDPVVDLPDQGLLFIEGCEEFFLGTPPVGDIPVAHDSPDDRRIHFLGF